MFWIMIKMIAEQIFVIEIISISIISTAPKRGNTIDTVRIVPIGLSEPGIILTYVIIITGQIRSARDNYSTTTSNTHQQHSRRGQKGTPSLRRALVVVGDDCRRYFQQSSLFTGGRRRRSGRSVMYRRRYCGYNYLILI